MPKLLLFCLKSLLLKWKDHFHYTITALKLQVFFVYRREISDIALFADIDYRQLGTIEDTWYEYHTKWSCETAADNMCSIVILVHTRGIIGENSLIRGIESLIEELWQSPLTAVSVSRKDKVKALAVTAEAVVYLLGLMKKQYIIILIIKLIDKFFKLGFLFSPF